MSETQPKPMFFVKNPSNGAVQGPMSPTQLKSWYQQGGKQDWGVAKTPDGPWTVAGKVKGLAQTADRSLEQSQPATKHGGGTARVNQEPPTKPLPTPAAAESQPAAPASVKSSVGNITQDLRFRVMAISAIGLSLVALGVLISPNAGETKTVNQKSPNPVSQKTAQQIREEGIIAKFESGIRSQLKDPTSLAWVPGYPVLVRFVANSGDADFWSAKDASLRVGQNAFFLTGQATATNTYGGRISETFLAIYDEGGTEIMKPIVMDELVKWTVHMSKFDVVKDLSKTIILDAERQVQGTTRR